MAVGALGCPGPALVRAPRFPGPGSWIWWSGFLDDDDDEEFRGCPSRPGAAMQRTTTNTGAPFSRFRNEAIPTQT